MWFELPHVQDNPNANPWGSKIIAANASIAFIHSCSETGRESLGTVQPGQSKTAINAMPLPRNAASTCQPTQNDRRSCSADGRLHLPALLDRLSHRT